MTAIEVPNAGDMRTNVVFNHPAQFVPVSPDDGVLSVAGADWFVSLLKQVPELEVDTKLCQEDWGVVVFARRNDKRFWIGLSLWPDERQVWLVHFHHHSFAWLQRWTAAGKNELQQLVLAAHAVFCRDTEVSGISWYYEHDIGRPDADGSEDPAAR